MKTAFIKVGLTSIVITGKPYLKVGYKEFNHERDN